MFNGIIYNTGVIKEIKKRSNGINLFIQSDLKINSKNIGISVSCDGVCLTLISYKKKVLEFFLSDETIKRSRFKKSVNGDIVNLELPLKKGQYISGHICQGHVDTTAVVSKIKKIDKALIFTFNMSRNDIKYLVTKASILINGISLTISNIKRNNFEIWIIPHTLKLTNLSKLNIGDMVNIEIDILSKYVKKFVNEKKI